MNRKRLYTFGPLAVLGIVALIAVPVGISSNVGQTMSGPLEGMTSYPRGTGGGIKWKIFYNPSVTEKWEYARIVETANGEKTTSYSPSDFQKQYEIDLGRAMRPTDWRRVVSDFKDRVPAADLVRLEIILGCPTTTEAVKSMMGQGIKDR
ncbi:MAG: hypothetical protein EYC62_03950 [Alphaproteobacteria bacterium]|nr:MAG: hypothetical protein EYC62_03950 [Alphaproteobacteria bacterium]